MDSGDRDVSLTIPAKPAYLVLARLALSAVCRLTPLDDAEVADLKLAVTEAANDYVEQGSTGRGTLDFAFRLKPECLELELSGPPATPSEEEQELRRAIIEATVDAYDFSPGHTVLVKQL